MFKIRKEQVGAFREESIRDFEQQMLDHLQRCFPERWPALGEARARELIRAGIARAARHGIDSEGDVCKLVDLMLVFGADFDERCAWAKDIWSAPELATPHAKLMALHRRALEEA